MPKSYKQREEPEEVDTMESAEQADVVALKELFAEYDKADEALEEAKAQVEEATRERSKVLEKIMEVGGAGPYIRGGRQLKICKRGTTHFLRGKGDVQGIEV